jgi:hypothetical protein
MGASFLGINVQADGVGDVGTPVVAPSEVVCWGIAGPCGRG